MRRPRAVTRRGRRRLPRKQFLEPRLQRAPDASFAGQHDEHQQETDEQFPVADQFADDVFHAGIDEGADQRPEQRADPAEDGDNDRIGGARRAGDLRTRETQINRIERAGQRGSRVGDDEREQAHAKVAVAEKLQLALVDLGGKAAGAE